MRVRPSPASTVSAPVAPPRAGTLFPAQGDTLFWCFYIIHKGIFAYETVKDKSFVEEKQVKIQLVTELRAADLKALSAVSGCFQVAPPRAGGRAGYGQANLIEDLFVSLRVL